MFSSINIYFLLKKTNCYRSENERNKTNYNLYYYYYYYYYYSKIYNWIGSGEKKVYSEFQSQANMHPKSAINLPPSPIKHSNKGNQPKPLKLDIKTHHPHWSLQQKKEIKMSHLNNLVGKLFQSHQKGQIPEPIAANQNSTK